MLETPFEPGSHPSPDQLADFGRGEVDDTLADAIEGHLSGCAECLKTLEGARPDDLWLALLRAVGPSISRSSMPGADGPAHPFGYDLEAVIGRGGMGVVHRARQVGLDRRVALKMLAAGRDASPHLVERFRREVEAAASLNHPAIVPIHDVGVRDGVPFYAMDLLAGGTLADRLALGPLGIVDAVALVERLARAVDHAHRQGIVHRDLKPSNILFDAEGAAKVSDFGLAKRLDADPDAATRSSIFLGTPSYMAPEQASGRPESVGPAVDVHALGAILFECLAGRPPFQGPDPLEILEQIRTAEPPRPGRFRPGLPADLETICLTCLEKDPARRYASASALADDLGRFARGEPIMARPTGPLDRAAKWARRRPAEAALVAFVALALIGTIAGLLVHQAQLRVALRREAEATDEARRQRTIAESNYRDAREAITRVLAALSEPRFAGTPRGAEIHRAQAEAALDFYDKVLRRTGSTDPVIRLDTARAAVEAANLQIALGRPGPAEANLLLAQGHYRALLADRPDDRDLIRDRMIAHIKLGVLLMEADTRRAVAELETARSLARRRIDLSPTDGRSEHDLSWCEHNLGSAWLCAGDHKRALPHCARAIELYDQSAGRAPDDVSLRVELAQSLINLGLAHAETGDPTGAEADYRRADTLLAGALAARPDTLGYEVSRCELLVNWGNLDMANGRLEAALVRYGRGLQELAPLLETEPSVRRLKTAAINLHGSRAIALEKARRFREAAADWQQLIELSNPGPATRGYTISRLLCLARAGDYQAIRTGAAPLEAQSDLSAIDRYNLACALSLASSAAPPDSAEPPDLQARAIKAVEKAFAEDSHLRETARQDADLQPLADDPAFRRALDGPR